MRVDLSYQVEFPGADASHESLPFVRPEAEDRAVAAVLRIANRDHSVGH
jgi:hypothetical protein